MGRPEQPIADQAPFKELALILRQMRNAAELTLEELAARVGYTPSALSKAAAGISLSGERLLRAWALQCGQPDRADELCQLRSELSRKHQQRPANSMPDEPPRLVSADSTPDAWPDPRQLHTPEQLMEALRLLRVIPPLLTYSTLQKMTKEPRSTFHDMFHRATLPRFDLYSAFLDVRGVSQFTEWRAAFTRAQIYQDQQHLKARTDKTTEHRGPADTSEQPPSEPGEHPAKIRRPLFGRRPRKLRPRTSS
jgi:transcriptional regulator with XRE-family HTH domain